MNKKELRKIYQSKREQLSSIDELSTQIADSFFEQIDLSEVEVVHIFLPIENKKEINTWYIIRELWANHPDIRVVSPVADFSNNTMKSIRLTPDTKLKISEYGIPEPEGTEVNSDEIDIVVTPLLISDLRGYRTGYGKGFYDRFFTNQCRIDVHKVGLSFFSPIERIEDVDDHDVRLDQVIHSDLS